MPPAYPYSLAGVPIPAFARVKFNGDFPPEKSGCPDGDLCAREPGIPREHVYLDVGRYSAVRGHAARLAERL